MSHPILGLGHIGLFVEDLDRSVRFWTELIGFQITDGSVKASPSSARGRPRTAGLVPCR